MATLVVYYSYSGNSKKVAQKLAQSEHADTLEIKDNRRPNMWKAFWVGCPKAIFGGEWAIAPISTDLTTYDKLIIVSPIWAGGTPPAVNSLLSALPSGKTVSVRLVSASGANTCSKRLTKSVAAKGCVLEGIEDIKSSKKQ
ncbi:MAG: hypothetical protein LBN40_01575 [Oscillospiraceae bacterium]|jgi:flavodoxin|nr:hypothetical protein [Oscillospiraceae bacterium]